MKFDRAVTHGISIRTTVDSMSMTKPMSEGNFTSDMPRHGSPPKSGGRIVRPRGPIPIASPVIGICSVITGTALAVALIPENHRPAGALFASAVCMIVGLLFPPGMAVASRAIAAFRVEHLLMLGLTYWLMIDHLQAVYDMNDVGREAVVMTFLAIGLFASAIWVSALQPPWRLPAVLEQSAGIDLNARYLFMALLVCAGIAMFRFAWPCRFDVVLMFESLAGNRFSAPWARAALGGWDSFIDHLQYFGYLLPTLVVLIAHRVRSWANAMVILGILITLIVAAFIAHGGARRVVGVMFGAAMLCWALLPGRPITVKTLIMLAFGVVAVLFVMQVMLEFRMRGYGDLLDAETRAEPHFDHLHVDDNFLRLAQILEMVPDEHPFTYEKVFIWVAVRPIPRVLWEGKPIDPGIDLTSAVGLSGLTITCSAIGELYLSWGWPTVVLGGWLFGRLGSACNRFLTVGTSPAGVLMYAAGTMAVFAGLRSLIEIILMGYMLLAWCGVVWLLKMFGFRPGMARVEARG